MIQMPRKPKYIMATTNKCNELPCKFKGSHQITNNCMFATEEEAQLADEVAQYCKDQNDWRWKFIATARILDIESTWAVE
jgi:hypothetical protein